MTDLLEQLDLGILTYVILHTLFYEGKTHLANNKTILPSGPQYTLIDNNKIISHCIKIGYNINVLQQTACLVVNPITVGNFAFLFNCTPVGRTSDSMMVQT